MKKTIFLTESDLKHLISECVLEYCTHNRVEEGKTGNILTALGLVAGGITGLGYTDTPNTKQQQIIPPQTMYQMDKSPKNNDSTINYYDYVKNQITNRFKQTDNNPKQEKPQIQREYYPSDNVINFIKSYESFHEGWIDDGDGNLTTGWGFKMTPELKKRFPTGMHRDKNGNTPEADAYLKEYINNNLGLFKKYTPNLDKLPQEYADALFDVYYNVGPNVYKNSPNLQHALKNVDLPQIANNLKYGKLKGHKKRSADRKNMLKGNYKRS